MCSMSAVYNTVAVCIVCFGHRIDCSLPSQVLLVIVLHVDFKCQLPSGCVALLFLEQFQLLR
jgi:hypothetical protein